MKKFFLVLFLIITLQFTFLSRMNTVYAMSEFVEPTTGKINCAMGTNLRCANGSVYQGIHHGFDIGARAGTLVYSVSKGVVKEAGWNKSMGNYVRIVHDINGSKYSTYYMHFLEKPIVSNGTIVSAGTQVGKVGNTGNSFGDHLHIEFIQGEGVWTSTGTRVPLTYFIPSAKVGSNLVGGRKVFGSETNSAVVKNYASMDSLEYRDGFIHARGWAFNTDLQPTYPTDLVAISYTAFLMDADRGIELARTAEGFYYRDDVANVFSRFKNVGYGGFKVKFQMQQGWEGKNVFLMIRFANDDAGNWPKVDDNYQLKDNKITLPKSDGGLDELTISNQGLRARGWHLSPIAVKYRYLFILDKNTGLELGRTRIVNTFRPDAGNLHPTYPNSTEGGFDVTLPIQSHWRGKEIFVMTRYTNNEAGDHAIDDISYPTRKITVSV